MQTRCEKDILIGSVVINKSWYIGDSICVGPLKRIDEDTRDLTRLRLYRQSNYSSKAYTAALRISRGK